MKTRTLKRDGRIRIERRSGYSGAVTSKKPYYVYIDGGFYGRYSTYTEAKGRMAQLHGNYGARV